MNNKYTAIIVEPRKHIALEFVLNNFLENLNNDWNIIIYHGNKNIIYLQDIIDTKLEKYKNRITCINLNIDNLTINDYNNLMTNKNFIKSIPTEIFLIFQTDTMICEQHKDLIYNFLQYDYVGGPWKKNHSYGNIILDYQVGNGGLSLRRKSKMLEILDKCYYNKNGKYNEDIYFSFGCNDIIINKPLYKEALNFSIEEVYNDKSFGVHKSWNHFNNDLINKQCKNYDQLVDLNIEKFININKLVDLNMEKYKIIYFLIFIIILLFIIHSVKY
jgi:hypothetical protein